MCDVAVAAVAATAAVERRGWLAGSGWTAVLLVYAALGLSLAPTLWGYAELRVSERLPRRAWALAGILNASFGLVTAVVAVANLRSDLVGGVAWSAALGVLAAYWLLHAVADLRSARL